MVEVDNKKNLDKKLCDKDRVVTLFYASWCPHCTRFVPIFKKKIVELTFVNVVYVLLDDLDNPLWDNYDIEAVPTIIFFEKGKISKRLDSRFGVGLSDKQLKDWLEKIKPE